MKNNDAKNSEKQDAKLAMVADKDRVDNLALCRMLEKEGYKAIPVFSLREALVVLRRPRIDLVLLDSAFDKSDHVVEAVTAHKSGEEIPIYVIRNKYYTKNKRLTLALN